MVTQQASVSAGGPPAFLGRGLARPFRRDQKRDFASASGVENVQASVGQILGTQASDESGAEGELPWRPEFGSLLHRLKHRKGYMLAELAGVWVGEALKRWEPRVRLNETSASFDNTTRVLSIRVRYDIIEQNVNGNNVLVAGVHQTVDVPLAS